MHLSFSFCFNVFLKLLLLKKNCKIPNDLQQFSESINNSTITLIILLLTSRSGVHIIVAISNLVLKNDLQKIRHHMKTLKPILSAKQDKKFYSNVQVTKSHPDVPVVDQVPLIPDSIVKI